MIPTGGKNSLKARVEALVIRFAKDERGATMVEYGLLVALISAAILGTLMAIGEEMKADFTYISESLRNSK